MGLPDCQFPHCRSPWHPRCGGWPPCRVPNCGNPFHPRCGPDRRLEPLESHSTIKNLMNEDQLKAWILRRLGAPYLRIEHNDDKLNDNIDDAKKWFAAKKGVKKQDRIFISSGRNDYPLTDDMDTILDVAFPIPPLDISLIFSPYLLVDEKVPYDVFASPGQIGLYSSFTQSLQYVETAKKVLSADPDWRQVGRTLYIFPIPRCSRHIIVDYKSTNVVIDQLNERDHDLIRRYSLAKARADIGTVRSKYDGYPTAAGMTNLDGKEQLALSEKEIEKLEEEIIQSGFPMMSFFA